MVNGGARSPHVVGGGRCARSVVAISVPKMEMRRGQICFWRPSDFQNFLGGGPPNPPRPKATMLVSDAALGSTREGRAMTRDTSGGFAVCRQTVRSPHGVVRVQHGGYALHTGWSPVQKTMWTAIVTPQTAISWKKNKIIVPPPRPDFKIPK